MPWLKHLGKKITVCLKIIFTKQTGKLLTNRTGSFGQPTWHGWEHSFFPFSMQSALHLCSSLGEKLKINRGFCVENKLPEWLWQKCVTAYRVQGSSHHTVSNNKKSKLNCFEYAAALKTTFSYHVLLLSCEMHCWEPEYTYKYLQIVNNCRKVLKIFEEQTPIAVC